MFEKHRNKILLSLLFAILVYAGLLLISDLGRLGTALRGFHWELTPIVVGLTVFNYGLRFLKWHYYLRLVGVRELGWTDSLLVFLAGFSMTITPGKAGEFLKSFLVQQRTGTPLASTAPIVLAERMTDGLAMLLLAALGLLLFDSPAVRAFMFATLIIAGVSVSLVQNRRLAGAAGRYFVRAPFLASHVHHLRAFYNSAYELLRFKSLALAISLGFVSWSGECIALALVLYGLGIPLSGTLIVLSAFAMGFATLAGSVLLTPGGLGVAEGSIDGLLLAFGRAPWLESGIQIGQPVAAAATLLIRFATLWFGVAIGFIALFVAQRRIRARPSPQVSG